jgi:hypothetical protein
MGVDTPSGLAMSDSALAGSRRSLFTYAASKEGRVVARLYGFESDEQKVRVAAELYRLTLLESSEPEWRFYDFPTRDRALRFADEALLALECLGCTFTDTGVDGTVPGTTSA